MIARTFFAVMQGIVWHFGALGAFVSNGTEKGFFDPSPALQKGRKAFFSHKTGGKTAFLGAFHLVFAMFKKN